MPDQVKLTDCLPGRLVFSDGSEMYLPSSVTVKRFGEGLLVWDLDGPGRHARVAAGRVKADCESLIRYVSGN